MCLSPYFLMIHAGFLMLLINDDKSATWPHRSTSTGGAPGSPMSLVNDDKPAPSLR